MNKCCGVRCYITKTSNAWGQFAYTQLSSGNKNNALDSSISLSYNGNSASYQSALRLGEGNIVVKTVNLSKNKCQYNTAIICIPSSSGTCSISFSSINGNEASQTSVILLGGSSSYNGINFDVTYSNIINNKVSNSDGVIKAWGDTNIKHCCLLDNPSTTIFQAGSGGYIQITNCTIDEKDITKTSGSVTTNDWKPSSSFGIVQHSMRTWKYEIHNN